MISHMSQTFLKYLYVPKTVGIKNNKFGNLKILSSLCILNSNNKILKYNIETYLIKRFSNIKISKLFKQEVLHDSLSASYGNGGFSIKINIDIKRKKLQKYFMT